MNKKLMFFFFLFLNKSSTSSLLKLFNIEKHPLHNEIFITNHHDIIKIMDETADFLKKINKYPSKFITVTPGLFENFGITMDDVLNTLEFISKTAKENPEKLQNPNFLNENFIFYRWHGDSSQKINPISKGWAQPPESIITTQYRITEIPASYHKNEDYLYPLYTLPDDEKDLSKNEISLKKDVLKRFKYTKNDFLNGAPEKDFNKKPFAWLTNKGIEELNMQGSSLLVFSKNDKKLVRVSADNGMKDENKYWFYSYVEKRKKNKFPIKVKPRADVTYAGDIDLLGFGKVILLKCWNPINKRRELRIGVLVDTGSAFKKNLAKLDMFAGYFPTDQAFKNHIKSYPHTARAYILIKKK